MKIIISPAKKMNMDTNTLSVKGIPSFLDETRELMQWIKHLTKAEAQKLWNCSQKLAEINYRRFQEMNLEDPGCLTPALLSYEGIQYQYMAPAVFTDSEWEYVQEHLRVLSGFYGILKPLDGVVPYRLEMQAKVQVRGEKDLYAYWGRKLYDEITKDQDVIINLASKEYSRCIEDYLKPEDFFLTCVFGEQCKGKVVQKGTLAKMARGEMVRFLAERRIEDIEEIQKFDRLGYRFSKELSSAKKYVFLKEKSEKVQA